MNTAPKLTRRERQVIALLLKGRSNQQIALALHVSVRTIEFHLTNIYAKFGVSSRVELIVLANQQKLGESTVEKAAFSSHNGKQISERSRWKTQLRLARAHILKELAMTKNILIQDIRSYFQDRPLFLAFFIWVLVSIPLRAVLIGLGLYFWVSYSLLALSLGAASLYLGWSWPSLHQNDPKRVWRNVAILLTAIGAAALVDVVLLHSVAKNVTSVATSILGVSNTAMWRVSSEGIRYLYRQRMIAQDLLWIVSMTALAALTWLGAWAQQRSQRNS